MSYAWLSRGVLPRVLALLLLGGCGGATIPDDVPDDPPTEITLEFEDPTTLELAPSEQVSVSLLTQTGERVSILMLGDALDASLESASVQADADGVATVQLTAPSQPTTFVLRAQVGSDASAELHVAVSELGFVTLDLVPVYEGERELSLWSADVVVGGDCGAILAGYPTDPVGALHVSASQVDDLQVGSVPVGPQLAVAIRSEQLAAGCVVFQATKPDSVELVSVTLLDRPMILGDAELDVSLEYTPDPTSYGIVVERSSKTLADVAFPQGTAPTALVLDAMSSVLSADAITSLDALRAESTVELQLAALLDGVDPNGLCVSLAQGAASAAVAAAASDDQRVEGRLSGSPQSPGAPTFTLTSFAGLWGDALGPQAAVPFSWSATADDVLVVSGLVPVATTRLAAHYMNLALSAQVGVETTVPATLSAEIDCPAVALAIVTAGAIDGCDEGCLAAACEAGLAARWQAGVSAGESTDGSIGSLQIGISGEATVSDELLPVALAGSWLGTLSAEEQEASVMGVATGQAPPPR